MIERLRADIGISRYERQVVISRGLVSGYTAKLAAFAGKGRLDKMNETRGYCGKFYWLVGTVAIGIYCLLGGSKLTS